MNTYKKPFTVGIKRAHTFHLDTIYDANEKAVCMVYGVSSNQTLDELDERDAAGLATARKIVKLLNEAED